MSSHEATPARAPVDDIGDKIGDLRAHLGHAHPLPPTWVDELEPAELAALHRRLHGRAVDPEPSLVDARLVELSTDPAVPATTVLPLEQALDHDGGLVWLPLRIVDRLHAPDAPGHTVRGGCRACADIIDATIRSLRELDRAPQARIAELEADVEALVAALEQTRVAMSQLRHIVVGDAGGEPVDSA